MSRHAGTARAPQRDGRRDFHFLFGRWHILNQKLADPFDDASGWLAFESKSIVRPVLGGLGNIDEYSVAKFPGRGPFEGVALRLFDPATRLWRIWWASTAQPGTLDTPVLGKFVDSRGLFECDDAVGGRSVRVRYEWTDITPNSARWEQSFSIDGGRTFSLNWIQELARDA